MSNFLTRTRGRGGADWTDWACYVYLLLGVVVMLLPVLWLVLSSIKSQAALDQTPPTLLPYEPVRVTVPGRTGDLPLMKVTNGPLAGHDLAEIRRLGLQAQLVDPADPATIVRVPLADRAPVLQLRPAPPGATIPTSSPASTSPVTSTTAPSSPSSPPSSPCCSTPWPPSPSANTAFPAAA